MKKLFASLLIVALMMIMSMTNVFAAVVSAYETINMGPDTICVDYDDGVQKEKIRWTGDMFKIGYTTAGDYVELPDVDFGSKGAAKVTVSYSNGEQKNVQFAVMIDDPESEAIATIELPNSGGWDKFKDSTADVKGKITGKHTVYVKWLGPASLGSVKFTESTASTASASNPKTGDMGVIIPALMAVSAAGTLTVINRRKNKK